MPTMSVLCLYYAYYACTMPTMPVLCLHYAYYACTMPTMPVLCLLCLYYAYYACTMPTMPIYNYPTTPQSHWCDDSKFGYINTGE